MAILTEGARSAEFLISEANGYGSREEVTVTLPEGGYSSGTILGKITASSKYVLHAAGASNGSEDETGILLMSFEGAAAGDVSATIIARNAEVRQADLTYEDGADAAQIATSNAALSALGIAVR